MPPGSVKWEIYNGETVPAGLPLFTASNRAVRYGDGIFETFCVRDGVPLFFNDHAMRFSAGLHELDMRLPASLSADGLHDYIGQLVRINDCLNARVRLLLMREAGGNYRPENTGCSWHLSITGMVKTAYDEDPAGITAGVYEADSKSAGRLSNLKSLNSLLYIRAGIYATRSGLDDVFIRNAAGNIIEATSSNVFICKGETVVTPPLSEGCLEGVMRKQVLALSSRNGLSFTEQPVREDDLLTAHEVFLTNVITGAVPVRAIGSRNYETRLAGTLNGWLNEMNNGSR